MKRILTLTIAFLVSISSVTAFNSFAATYILLGYQTGSSPDFTISKDYSGTSMDYYIRQAVSNWNLKLYPHGKIIYNDTAGSSLNKIRTVDNPYSSRYGTFSPQNDGSFIIYVNSGLIDLETSTDDTKKEHYYRFTVAHELGHALGLGDLGMFDTWNSIMSEYANKNNLYIPTEHDVVGVKAAYKLN